MKINDGRIGSKDKKGMIEKYPTHYATGGFWNRSANSTPSTCYFGKNGDYFFVLPILVPTISETLWDEFYKLIEEERPVVMREPKVAKEVVEVEEIKGISDSAPSIMKPKAKKPRIQETSDDQETSRPEDDGSQSELE